MEDSICVPAKRNEWGMKVMGRTKEWRRASESNEGGHLSLVKEGIWVFKRRASESCEGGHLTPVNKGHLSLVKEGIWDLVEWCLSPWKEGKVHISLSSKESPISVIRHINPDRKHHSAFTKSSCLYPLTVSHICYIYLELNFCILF